MTAFNKKQLLSNLHDRTEIVRINMKVFLRLSENELNYKPAPEKWSIAEVFEHLNITQGLYLKSIDRALSKAEHRTAETFKSNWLGNFAYDKIMPRPDGTVFKMKAPKFLHAPGSQLDGRKVLETFLKQLDELDHILQLCRYTDLQRIKIPFSFTKLLRLRLGDSLRFIVAHNERHLLQALKVLEQTTTI